MKPDLLRYEATYAGITPVRRLVPFTPDDQLRNKCAYNLLCFVAGNNEKM